MMRSIRTVILFSVTVTDALFIAKWLANPNFPLWDPIKDSDMLKPVP